MAAEERGWIPTMLAKIFGASFATSLSGYGSIAALAIHEKPVLIQWIAEPLRTFVWHLSEYIFAAGIIMLANRSKDKKVTGGSIPQTSEGHLAESSSTSTRESEKSEKKLNETPK